MRFSLWDVLKTAMISLAWIIISSVLVIAVLGHFSNGLEFSIGTISIIIFVVVVLCINKYMIKKNKLTWEALGFRRLKKKQLVKLTWQIPLLWILMIATQLIFILIYFGGDTHNLPETQNGTASLEINLFTIFAVFIAIALVTPLIEEIIFRGGILQALKTKYNTFIAILLSSVLFLLAHPVTLIMPALLVAGLSFGYLYHKYDSIYPPILHHMFINSINVIAVSAFSFL
ncbi:CAAX prenyl protease-like protein [Sinobaca qinghaiensis]|uniref:CAAX prenyl protease-like protein n=1 Tax=Sinobaca qinghaiensis TaxID=342944 RepID=A0A419UWW0_9BACL|nr:type II CAAX endopeptidase family protein [Sinobaca qinghaiensis]RKD69610.1 CAAX prenyl protease-like protein [Sinobaca qinghaiensis]